MQSGWAQLVFYTTTTNLTLENIGIPPTLVNNIKLLYENSICSYNWYNIQTPFVPTNQGVKQGCPLSSALFLCFTIEYDSMLNEKNNGFIFDIKSGTLCNGSAYVDDSVLLAGTEHTMQNQLDIATEFADKNHATFCKEKSKILIYNEQQEKT